MTRPFPRRLAALAALLLAAAGPARADGPGFQPGEETVFEVSYLHLPTGEGRIVVGKPEGDVWPVIFQAKTDGVAGFIDIREHLVSYWDAVLHLPRGSDLRAYEVGDYHADTARFDRETNKATVVIARKTRRKEHVVDVVPGEHDLTSAFMWLRLQSLAPGQRIELPVLASTKPFTMIADVLGRETIETPAGTFPALKVKVQLQLDGKFETRSDSFLWLSDDPRHVLVRAQADFVVGSIVVKLKSYRPGAPVASR